MKLSSVFEENARYGTLGPIAQEMLDAEDAVQQIEELQQQNHETKDWVVERAVYLREQGIDVLTAIETAMDEGWGNDDDGGFMVDDLLDEINLRASWAIHSPNDDLAAGGLHDT